MELLLKKRQMPDINETGSETARFSQMQKMQREIQAYINSAGLSLLNRRLTATDEEENSKPSVHAYFIAKIFQHLTHSRLPWLHNLKQEGMMKIAAVGEYCITILYLENHFHDGKFGVIDKPSREKNRAELKATQEALDHYIQTEFSGIDQEKITKTVEKLFSLYEIGLLLNGNTLTYENFVNNNPDNFHRISECIDTYVNVDSFIFLIQQHRPNKYVPFEQKNYLKLLFTRAFLVNAVFFQVFTELLIDLYAFPSRDYTYLIQFARIYGMAQQLVNDNCDYAPISYGLTTVCKLPEDTFSDMKLRLLTLPMMAYFAKSKSVDKSLVEHYNGSTVLNIDAYETSDADIEQRRILELLKQSGAISYSMGVLNGLVQTGEILIPELKGMLSFVRANRYYKTYTSK